VFWSSLYSVAKQTPRFNSFWGQIYLVVNHSAPLAATLINFAISDVVLLHSHCKYFVGIGVLYLGINFSVTLAIGKPLYYFLTWKDA